MARESLKDKKKRALIIFDILNSIYEDATCSLDYENALQLLIATQLAAQCTDKRVNIVTKKLFKKYKNVHDFANCDLEELEQDIKSTGFYRNKAKNIKECCQILIDEYNGEVPNTMEQLVKLPGVGRKTANVVLAEIFNVPGIIVDTHAKRLNTRLGFTTNEDPVKIEFDVQKILPPDKWSKFSHLLVFHGRECCKARKPRCEICPVNEYCPKKGVRKDSH